jgi:hypothetical protein
MRTGIPRKAIGMKNILSRLSTVVAIAVLGTVLVLPAGAQSHGGRGGGHYGGGHYGGGHHGGWGGGLGRWGLGLGVGLGIGAGYLASPYGSEPYPYPDPAYNDPYDAVSPVVIPYPANEAPLTPALPRIAPGTVWYYCESTNGYYPNVMQCPQPWRLVPATPPGVVR